jgi:hypothetical protein
MGGLCPLLMVSSKMLIGRNKLCLSLSLIIVFWEYFKKVSFVLIFG